MVHSSLFIDNRKQTSDIRLQGVPNVADPSFFGRNQSGKGDDGEGRSADLGIRMQEISRPRNEYPVAVMLLVSFIVFRLRLERRFTLNATDTSCASD